MKWLGKKIFRTYLLLLNQNPLIAGGLFSLAIFWQQRDEWVLYLYTVVYAFYYFPKKDKKRVELVIMLALICPSFIKMGVLLALGTYQLTLVINRYSPSLTGEPAKGILGAIEKVYMRHSFLFFVPLIFSLVLLYIVYPAAVVSELYANYKVAIEIVFLIYFGLMICIFFIYFMISLTIELTKAVFHLESSEKSIFRLITQCLLLILAFLFIPDAIYSFLYYSVFPMIGQQSYSLLAMFYYSFLLHHLIPMNSYYLGIENEIQGSYVMGWLRGLHVYTLKIYDSAVILPLVLTILSNRIIQIVTAGRKVVKGERVRILKNVRRKSALTMDNRDRE